MIPLRRPICLTRRGSAMVDLVLSMLPLTLMFGLLLWVSQFAWQLPAHTCRVRNAAWEERYSDSTTTSKVFDFESAEGIQVAESARVTGIGPAFDRFPDISAKNQVLAGSWDYRQIKLDRPPHWELARNLAVKSQPEKLKGLGKLLPPSPGLFAQNLRDEAILAAGPLQDASRLIDSISILLPGIQRKNSDNESARRAALERDREEFAANRVKLVKAEQAARANLQAHEQLIRQQQEELQSERQKLAAADEEKLKEEIQKKIDRLEDEVLPDLEKERVKLAGELEEAAGALQEFDTLEPPAVD